MSSMMPPLLAASYLALAAMQVTAPAEPPAIPQIYREPLKRGAEAEYDRLERRPRWSGRPSSMLRATGRI